MGLVWRVTVLVLCVVGVVALIGYLADRSVTR